MNEEFAFVVYYKFYECGMIYFPSGKLCCYTELVKAYC